MKIGRTLGLQLVKKLLQRLFPFGRTLELQKHVIQRNRVRHAAAIVFRPGFWAHVARERSAIGFVGRLYDSGARINLSTDVRRGEKEGANNESGSESQFADHGVSFVYLRGP